MADDLANAVERENPEYRNARVTLAQRLLKDGDRLLTLGEVENAIGTKNNFVWTTIWALLQKYKSPGLESLTEEEISRELFDRLPSLGINKAHALAYSGHRTLEDLLEEPRVKPKVKNFIKLLKVQDRAISRAEVEEYRERLGQALSSADTKYNFELVGAYRRGAAYSQSINVLVWHDAFERPEQESGIRDLYRTLEKEGIFRLDNMLMSGPNSPPTHVQMGGFSSLGEDRPLRHLEIRIVPMESVPYRLFWDTGAEWLVRHMVLEARKRGLKLWPGGMQPLGQGRPPKTAILVDDERELFQLLDVPWIEPTQRGYKNVQATLPKLRAWSSASRPSSDYLRRVLSQATVVKPDRVHPTNVSEIVAASRLPVPKERTHDVPAFPKIDIEGATADIEMVQRRAAASLSRGRFEKGNLARLQRRHRNDASVDESGSTE
ncbi:Nucleotidyltransferase [Cutaneotrichosporon oleaginosum]|uniref:DNA polymerase n=1 Tax=Cutaneotrichosporon oleaginosum TaxID=879819 RepID=A0A0J1B5R5_9TREE|nr:Nucleotidyltransferase [Cutaneotrichosporon oleaginosum]KLT43044.1 Nucleotidyltransferase [Cutaneotrichosporon oleaginosum]TXT11755.1 hypothetical protein COLE_02165 [Cutaneotrichosporon oleaginosum]